MKRTNISSGAKAVTSLQSQPNLFDKRAYGGSVSEIGARCVGDIERGDRSHDRLLTESLRDLKLSDSWICLRLDLRGSDFARFVLLAER